MRGYVSAKPRQRTFIGNISVERYQLFAMRFAQESQRIAAQGEPRNREYSGNMAILKQPPQHSQSDAAAGAGNQNAACGIA
jgi:hypothetical protein